MTPVKRGSAADALLMAAVSGLALLVYAPALRAGFVADDALILARVQASHGLAGWTDYFHFGFFGEYYRPIAFLSQALDWTLWGTNAAGFHLTNICLHAANTALVFAIGRTLTDRPGACAAALLFALHPASHEAVYWIASRFDLLATGFALLALLLLMTEGAVTLALGTASFGLALLSKESALALPLMAVAYDVFVRQRSWQSTARRLLPLFGVIAGYALLRSAGADVAALGGASRTAKLVMVPALLAALLWMAKRTWPRLAPAGPARVTAALAWTTAAAVLVALLLAVPWLRGWTEEKLGFVAYVGFYLTSPVVFPAAPPYFLDPATPIYWLLGTAVALVIVFVGRYGAAWVSRQPGSVFLIACGVAALVPVSSLTGGTRYLYLASAATSLFASVLWRAASQRWRSGLAGCLAVVLMISIWQLGLAARRWHWAGDMTRAAVTLIRPALEPCGSKRVVLLTAPENIDGVSDNLYKESFALLGGCAPASVTTLLRIVREDAVVRIARTPDGVITLRMPHYPGNVKASRDLRQFDVPLRRSRELAFDTPLGRLTAQPDGDTEVFVFTPNAGARGALLYYYSDGRLREMPAPR